MVYRFQVLQVARTSITKRILGELRDVTLVLVLLARVVASIISVSP